jgi:hypothetical protein
MTRYSGPARIRIHGDQNAGSVYVGLARTLLGEQMAIHVDAYDSSRGLASQSQVSKNYTPKPTDQIRRRVSLPNGVGIAVQYNNFMPVIDIWVPEGVGEVTALEYRGLLRALQNEDEPCEPLEEPTGEPGDEDYDAGKFSELHPLYDPEDEDQQWLVYPDSISIEHNGFPNYPLPPRGGTFIMDMIGVPFNQRAFDNKPPLASCKMLVTGGGTIDNPEYTIWGDPPTPLDVTNWDFSESGADYNICPSRMFRVGRMNEMPGWPWLSSNDGITRLVSISGRMKHDWDTYYEDTTAELLIEFLKLNGEPFEPDENGYLEPIEIELYESYPYWEENEWTGHEYPFWYDFSVISITAKGDKAVIGLHQAGYQWYRGIPMDFVVLDLEADIEDQVRYISRYDVSIVAYDKCNYSQSELTLDQIAGLSLDTEYSEETGVDGISWVRAKVDIGPSPTEEDAFPIESTTEFEHYGECTYAIGFNSEGNLVRKFLRVTEAWTENESQTLETNIENDTLQRFFNIPQYSTLSSSNYSVGDVRMATHSYQGSTFENYYVCVQAHTGATTRRPGLHTSGANLLTDLYPEFWRIIYGRRSASHSCAWQGWNDFVDIDPTACQDGAVPALAVGEYGFCGGYLWMNTGASTRRVLRAPEIPVQTRLRQTLIRTSVFNCASTIDFCEVLLDDPEDSPMVTNTLTAISSNTVERGARKHSTETNCITGYVTSTGTHIFRSEVNAYTLRAESMSVTATWVPDSTYLESVPTTYTAPNFCAAYTSAHVAENNIFLRPDRYVNPCPDYYPGDFTYWGGCEWSNRIFSQFVWPIDGVGICIYPVSEATSSRSSPCITNQSNTVNEYINGGALTYHSNTFDVDFEDAVVPGYPDFWPSEQFMDLKSVRAITDPATHVYSGEVENDGFFLEPVFGPEKSIVCKEQQVAYVGWLYPQEMNDDD